MSVQALLRGFFYLFLFCLPESIQPAIASPSKVLLLDRGRPGCWDDIRGSVLTDAEVKALPEDCKNLRADYFSVLNLLQKNKPEFQKQISEVLTHSKKPAAPYEAILFATFIGDASMKKVLETRAEAEIKGKFIFKYAEAALWRLGGNACSDRKEFLHPFYREVCIGKDSVLKGLYEMAASK